MQDVRGKFRSEGETVPFAHEIEDGYDTLEWIASQPWSNGTVGMWGDSYYGYTQWAAVAGGHPALRAIVPRVTGTDFMDSRHWWGDYVLQLYGADYLAHFWADRYVHDFPVDYDHRPLAEIFDAGFAAIGKRSTALDRLILDRRPGGYAAYPPGRHPYECQKVPALHGVGWFDNVMPYSMADYTALAAMPGRAGLQYLYAEPIDHENYRLEDLPITPENDHDSNDAAMERLIPRLVGAVSTSSTCSCVAPAGRRMCLVCAGGPATGLGGVVHMAAARRARSAAASRRTAQGRRGLRRRRARHARGDRRRPRGMDPRSRDGSSRPATPDPFALLRSWPDERAVEDRPDVLTFTGDERLGADGPGGPR